MSTITLTQVEPAFASPMMLFQVQDCDVLNRQLVEEAAGDARAFARRDQK